MYFVYLQKDLKSLFKKTLENKGEIGKRKQKRKRKKKGKGKPSQTHPRPVSFPPHAAHFLLPRPAKHGPPSQARARLSSLSLSLALGPHLSARAVPLLRRDGADFLHRILLYPDLCGICLP